MPDPIELSTNSNSESPAPEHPLASSDIPTFEEHMAEIQKEKQAKLDTEPSIEERQKFIENPEERKAKIKSILQEITPDDLDEDFDYENYQGDNANDFFWDLSCDFMLKHMDDLIACGVKAGEFNKMLSDGTIAYDDEDFLDNFDIIVDHVGHGISFESFAKAHRLNGHGLEEKDEDFFTKLYDLGADNCYNSLDDYKKSLRKFAKVVLENGADAKQLIAESYAGTPENLDAAIDLFLDSGASAEDIASRLDEDDAWGDLEDETKTREILSTYATRL
ncbi:hypothetical protein IJH01_02290 [Candidatus Saccharibacteria bacterium]|nr:hypothetical protein [Candidatus Saccharibacteria bacterium]